MIELLCFLLIGQVMINGEVPGELWRTSDVSGEVEIIHPWGRTAVMPVKDAWVNVDGERISVGARTDDPILEGKARKGYFFRHLRGTLSKSFPPYIQTISQRSSTLVGVKEHQIYQARFAVVIFVDEAPRALHYHSVEFADFDVPEVSAKLAPLGPTGFLDGFDSDGFRRRSFQAVFGGGAP